MNLVVDFLVLSLAAAQIILQLLAAYFAYKIMLAVDRAWFWSLVILALLLMTARRITALMIELNVAASATGFFSVLDRVGRPFLISVLLATGFYALAKKLEKIK